MIPKESRETYGSPRIWDAPVKQGHHSDCGSQYAATSYQCLPTGYGLIPSMSRKGNCWDNACVESFFGTLERELVYHLHYVTRDEANQDIFEYIEVF